MLISGKGKYFHVFGCISKNFPENIFWCLEKKKDNTNPEKHKPQPRKKSRSTAREEDPRSRSTLRKIAPSITISRKSRDRDRAVDRDQWRGRRTGFVVIDRRRDLGSSSLAIDRDLDPVRDRAVDRFSSHSRALSLSLSLSFSGNALKGK